MSAFDDESDLDAIEAAALAFQRGDEPEQALASLNTSAGRLSSAESPVNYCWRCGYPGGDDWPTIADEQMTDQSVHVDCTPPEQREN